MKLIQHKENKMALNIINRIFKKTKVPFDELHNKMDKIMGIHQPDNPLGKDNPRSNDKVMTIRNETVVTNTVDSNPSPASRYASSTGSSTVVVESRPVESKGLNLAKKMELNLNKLNLDKDDVIQDSIFLLDVSGSMDTQVDKERKIDHLRKVMTKYPKGRKICFATKPYDEEHSKTIPEPDGGTDLARAIIYVQKMYAFKKIVLVSDGEPDDDIAAIRAAKACNVPIDIIYIGKEKGRGASFMAMLARETGGKYLMTA